MPDDAIPSALFPADNPAATTHITLLQGIITRLAGNSASCKTWCLTLVAALLSLAGAAHAPGVVHFATVPVVIFGFLDAKYLSHEQAYRHLFKEVVGKIRKNEYHLDKVYEAEAALKPGAWFRALRSTAVYPMYLTLLVAYGVAVHCGWLGVLLAAPGKP
jgi:hypothetical protein